MATSHASAPLLLQHAYGLFLGSETDSVIDSSEHIFWQHELVTHLPSAPCFSICPITRSDGLWIQHSFSVADVTHCVFEVSSDGRSLRSWSLPSVHADDVLELCSETVMRTVLCRLGYPAFHASALSKDGQAILLMGHKGAGKSTLASVLQQQGWNLLADDLVRVAKLHDTWHVFPGIRRNKLRADSMAALGNLPSAHRRWIGIQPPETDDEKLMVPSTHPLQDTSPVLIDSVVCLGERTSSLEVAAQVLTGPIAVLHLTEHLIRDPLPPHRPPQGATTMLSELLRQATIYSVQLPDMLSQLDASAAVLDTLLSGSSTS